MHLEPFSHQVAGQSLVFDYDTNTICKSVISRELNFYKALPDKLKPHVPTYKGKSNNHLVDTSQRMVTSRKAKMCVFGLYLGTKLEICGSNSIQDIAIYMFCTHFWKCSLGNLTLTCDPDNRSRSHGYQTCLIGLYLVTKYEVCGWNSIWDIVICMLCKHLWKCSLCAKHDWLSLVFFSNFSGIIDIPFIIPDNNEGGTDSTNADKVSSESKCPIIPPNLPMRQLQKLSKSYTGNNIYRILNEKLNTCMPILL